MPSKKPLVFLSYAHEDEDYALAFKRWAESALLEGFKFFLAGERSSIPPGTAWRGRITEALQSCDAAVLLLSPKSSDRPWIHFEAGAALAREIPVIPVCCKGNVRAKLSPPFSELQAIQLGSEQEESSLLQALADLCGLKPPSSWPPFAAEDSTPRTKLSVESEFSASQLSVQDAASALCEDVLASDFLPDTIVGVGRGGAIALGAVATQFRERKETARRLIPLQLLDRRYLHEADHRKTIITGLHTLDVQDRKVLLLNADSYTGRTITEAKEALRGLSPREVRTGALFVTESLDEPQFRGTTLPDGQTFANLPWRSRGYKFEERIDTAELAQRTLVVLHGLVGTGKTSVSTAISKQLRCIPIHTDEFWFKHGLRGREHDPGVSAAHYELMTELCWSVIGNGRDAILDCTSRWLTFRQKLCESFSPWPVTLVFVSCSCSEASILSRISQRKRFGPHDMGDEFEYRRVLREYTPISDEEAAKINLLRLDTDKKLCREFIARDSDSETVRRIRKAIEENYFARLKDSDPPLD